jgi:hypothetical protein
MMGFIFYMHTTNLVVSSLGLLIRSPDFVFSIKSIEKVKLFLVQQ